MNKTIAQLTEGFNENQLAGFKNARAAASADNASDNVDKDLRPVLALENGHTPASRQEYIEAGLQAYGPGDKRSVAGKKYASYARRVKRQLTSIGYKLKEGDKITRTKENVASFPLHLEKVKKEDNSGNNAPSPDPVTEPENGTPVQPKAKTNPVQYAQGIVDALPEDVTLYAIVKAMAGNLDTRQIANLARYCDKVLTADANSEDNTVEADKVA